VAEDHARARLDFDIVHRIALHPSEIPHLLLRELDVLDRLPVEACDAAVYLRLGQAVIIAVPLVETGGELAHGRVPAAFDVGEQLFDKVADLAIVLRACPPR
jgi:hypothetical protein